MPKNDNFFKYLHFHSKPNIVYDEQTTKSYHFIIALVKLILLTIFIMNVDKFHIVCYTKLVVKNKNSIRFLENSNNLSSNNTLTPEEPVSNNNDQNLGVIIAVAAGSSVGALLIIFGSYKLIMSLISNKEKNKNSNNIEIAEPNKMNENKGKVDNNSNANPIEIQNKINYSFNGFKVEKTNPNPNIIKSDNSINPSDTNRSHRKQLSNFSQGATSVQQHLKKIMKQKTNNLQKEFVIDRSDLDLNYKTENPNTTKSKSTTSRTNEVNSINMTVDQLSQDTCFRETETRHIPIDEPSIRNKFKPRGNTIKDNSNYEKELKSKYSKMFKSGKAGGGIIFQAIKSVSGEFNV